MSRYFTILHIYQILCMTIFMRVVSDEDICQLEKKLRQNMDMIVAKKRKLIAKEMEMHKLINSKYILLQTQNEQCSLIPTFVCCLPVGMGCVQGTSGYVMRSCRRYLPTRFYRSHRELLLWICQGVSEDKSVQSNSSETVQLE
ncbi:hypothetical protein DdX_21933 [Ditylenchus destructor]|uniref:Uncharacterized protein n=1 Tax=Ditylenchus destructor TaxID=166010 RepID=A0AAD4ME99_9BILA|nr:hypothetical protein DdX_21933 [Ditylenchus destructor]